MIKNMFGINISLEVRDPEGNVTHKHSEPGHSWVKNAYGFLLTGLSGLTAPLSEIIITDATTFSSDTISGICGGSDESIRTFLIRVGTSATAFSYSDYDLVAHLDLSSTDINISAAEYDTKVWTSSQTQVFTNDSGASQTITEIGYFVSYYITCHSSTTYPASTRTTLLARDVLSSSVSLSQYYSLTVHYNFTMDLSAVD